MTEPKKPTRPKLREFWVVLAARGSEAAIYVNWYTNGTARTMKRWCIKENPYLKEDDLIAIMVREVRR